MLDRLAELNRLLFALTAIMDERGAAPRDLVLQQCQATVIDSRLPNHEATIAFACRIGYVADAQSVLRITHAGTAFLELNPEKVYDLAVEQKRLLLRSVFLHGPLRTESFSLLREFAPSFKDQTFRWSEEEGSFEGYDALLIALLDELELLVRIDGGLVINHDFVKTVASFLEEGKGWSEQDFEEYLRAKRELGALAEDLVLSFEAERLRASGCAVECHCVRRISGLRVNAGYDIESYDGASKDLAFDRFIEVKGSRDPRLRLFWTENEMAAARKLGERYWIYFQGGIDAKLAAARNKPLMFRDPIRTLLPRTDVQVVPQGFVISSGMRGDAA
jgi:hypothetical protein